MSQQRTRPGRKGASSGEVHAGPAQGSLGRSQTPVPERGVLFTHSTYEIPLAEETRHKQTRGSAVHSILNPSVSAHVEPSDSSRPSPTQGSIGPVGDLESLYASSPLARDNFNSQARQHGQSTIAETYSARPDSSEQSYRHSDFPPLPPSASFSDRHMRPLGRTDTLSRGNSDPQLSYERTTTLLQRNHTRASDPQMYTSVPGRSDPAVEYSYGQTIDPARVAAHSPRSSTMLYPHASGIGASNLATGVGQLTIGRTPDANSPPSTRGAYRYHTMNTDQGPVSFPLEVQTASRVADEKRRRNAGASARFRARRKEKEQASSREIEGLRQQIQDLEEDVNFYRGERDYLATELYTSSGNSRHFPRPVSPRRHRPLRPRRLTDTMSAGSSSREEVAPPYREVGVRTAPERYSRRRLSQQPYEDLPGSVVRSEASLPYLPHSLPYQVPQQGHSYGTVQGHLPYPPERSPYEPPRHQQQQQQAYFHQSSSSPPPERPPPSFPDLSDRVHETGWSQLGRYKPP